MKTFYVSCFRSAAEKGERETRKCFQLTIYFYFERKIGAAVRGANPSLKLAQGQGIERSIQSMEMYIGGGYWIDVEN